MAIPFFAYYVARRNAVEMDRQGLVPSRALQLAFAVPAALAVVGFAGAAIAFVISFGLFEAFGI
jgi:hypothetical protein